jgi:glycine/D-amino acid oxidase-like deaminating enzyme
MNPALVAQNGRVSFWFAADGLPEPRPALPGSITADVCVVGGGFTGLWTAYYLALADPALRIVVCERRFAGFGASGRNGGWLTGNLAGARERYAATHGPSAVRALQHEMHATVEEVTKVAAAEGIDADIVAGGELTVARNPAQLTRLHAAVEADHAWGREDTELLGTVAVAERIRVAGALGGAFSPHCSRVHPARLVRGLADAVQRRGVQIYEGTTVTRIEPGRVLTPHGEVRAPVVVRATEGFTARLPGLRRVWLPMNSSMVVTQPLGPAFWDDVGWSGRETLGDTAHAYIYAQRTPDDRIAFGGRGVPYRLGSRTDVDGRTQLSTVSALVDALTRFFPAATDARIDHAWCGVLAVPRDWCASVGFDRGSGLGWAGGYTGHGVATANLAGRTLRDLILGSDSELTGLPWVNRVSRRWEPEPLRWLGVQALYAAYRAADAREARGGGTSLLARFADSVSGRPD